MLLIFTFNYRPSSGRSKSPKMEKMCLICKIDPTESNKTLRQHLNEEHEIPLETYNILNKIPNLKLRLDLKDPLETKSENYFLKTLWHPNAILKNSESFFFSKI